MPKFSWTHRSLPDADLNLLLLRSERTGSLSQAGSLQRAETLSFAKKANSTGQQSALGSTTGHS